MTLSSHRFADADGTETACCPTPSQPGSPAFLRPFTHLTTCSGRRNGVQSLRLETRNVGSNSRMRAMGFPSLLQSPGLGITRSIGGQRHEVDLLIAERAS